GGPGGAPRYRSGDSRSPMPDSRSPIRARPLPAATALPPLLARVLLRGPAAVPGLERRTDGDARAGRRGRRRPARLPARPRGGGVALGDPLHAHRALGHTGADPLGGPPPDRVDGARRRGGRPSHRGRPRNLPRVGAPDRRGGAGVSASPPGDVGLGGRRAAAPAARGLRRAHGPRGGDGGEAPPAAARGPPAGPRRRRTSAGLLRAPPGDSGPGRPPADPDQPEQRVFLERAVRQPGGAQRGMELLRLVGPRARPAHQSVRRDADGFGGGAGGRTLLSRRAQRAAP